jgi:hypothetical protein
MAYGTFRLAGVERHEALPQGYDMLATTTNLGTDWGDSPRYTASTERRGPQRKKYLPHIPHSLMNNIRFLQDRYHTSLR